MEINYSFQLKLRGDDFNGHFTNGLSMANSVSVRRCRKISEDDEKTVFEADEYRVTAYHTEKNGSRECYTVFENISDKSLTLDMLSSFCIENIDADTMHRATSFWSAEGKLLSQKLTELNMERSWSGHGTRVEKFGQIGSMPVRKYFPFAALENTEKGECIAVQLYCASSWQIVMREYDNTALLIVHTFKNGANPPIEPYLNGWNIADSFGSTLDCDFRGMAFLLNS